MISLRQTLLVTCVVSSFVCAQELPVEELKKKKVLADGTTIVVTEEEATEEVSEEVVSETAQEHMSASCDEAQPSVAVEEVAAE